MLSLEIFSLGQVLYMKEAFVDISQIYLFMFLGKRICSFRINHSRERILSFSKNTVLIVTYN